jgi:hypothetical protein
MNKQAPIFDEISIENFPENSISARLNNTMVWGEDSYQ